MTNKTTVTDTLKMTDGSLANGHLTIFLDTAMVLADGVQLIPATRTDAAVVAGAMSVSLYPNDTSLPTGTQYRVEYHLGASANKVATGQKQTEYWTVPETASVVDIASIRSTVTVASSALSLNSLVFTAYGDLAYGGTGRLGTRLAGNITTTKQFLTQTGTGTISAAPTWGSILAADLAASPQAGYVLTYAGGVSTWADPTTIGDITAVGDVTSGPAFTSGGTGTTLYLRNATSGAIALQTVAGALGSPTVQFPALSGVLALGGDNLTAAGRLMKVSAAGIATEDSALTVSGGVITATGFSGPLTGNVTGNASGTAATITGALALANTPLSTMGDMLSVSAGPVLSRVIGDTSNVRQFLRTLSIAGVAQVPAWDSVSKTDVGLSAVENTALSTWAGSSAITTVGTLGAGTVPWARLSDVPSYQASDADLTAIAGIAIARGMLITGQGASPAWAGLAAGSASALLQMGANEPGWSAYTVAAPGLVGAVLYSDGTNWTRNTAPTISAANMTSFPTLNQNTTGTASGLTSAYIDWSAVSGGAFIQNKPSTFTASAHNLLSAIHGDSTVGSAARDDIITAQGASPLWTKLAKGTQYQLLTGGANEPTWGAVSLDQATAISGTLPVGSGGTGATTLAGAGLVVGSANLTTAGRLVTVSAAGTVTEVTPVLGNLLYGSATPAWIALAPQTSATKMYLYQTGTGSVGAVPAWGQPAASELSNGVTGSGAVVLAASPILSGSPTIRQDQAGLTSLTITNLNGTAPAQSMLRLYGNGASSGDQFISFLDGGVLEWVIGQDVSDSNKFKLAASGSLDSSTLLTVTTSGAATFASSVDAASYKVSTVALASTHLSDTSGLVRGAASLTTAGRLAKVSAAGTLSEITAVLGNIVYGDATPAFVALAPNTVATKKYLAMTGTGSIGAVPSWDQPAASDLSNGVTGSGAIVLATSPTIITSLTTSGYLSAQIGYLGGWTFSGRNAGIYNAGAGDSFIYLTDDTNSLNAIQFNKINSTTVKIAFINGSVGVNTTTPPTELAVSSTSASDPRGIMSAQYTTDANGAIIITRKARGTEASPTTVVTADILGRIRFSGYDGSNYLQMASIDVGAMGTVASTRVPTYMAFSVGTDAAPSVLTEMVRITPTGVGLGTTGPGAKLELGGTITETEALLVSTTFPSNNSNKYVLDLSPILRANTNSYYGVEVNPTITASETVGNWYGVSIENPTKGSGAAVTNNYGLYIASQTSGGTNYAIYSAGGANYFGGNVGIATSLPTNLLSFGGNAARTFWMERHTTSNTAGNSLTIQAGGATAGATDKAGGSLILAPGLSTGTGNNQILFQTSTPGTTGTSDNALATRVTIDSSTMLMGMPLSLKAYTVATLPTGVTGMIAYVTDALTPTFLTPIVGGGAVKTPVFYDGTNWAAF